MRNIRSTAGRNKTLVPEGVVGESLPTMSQMFNPSTPDHRIDMLMLATIATNKDQLGGDEDVGVSTQEILNDFLFTQETTIIQNETVEAILPIENVGTKTTGLEEEDTEEQKQSAE